MLNDARVAWLIAVVSLGFTFFGGALDFGRADQKIIAQEKQLAAVMTQQGQQAESIAKQGMQSLDFERRLNTIERQMQAVSQIDTRLGRIEVIVEMIGRQVGADVPRRGHNP